jgi:hypothetical protein
LEFHFIFFLVVVAGINEGFQSKEKGRARAREREMRKEKEINFFLLILIELVKAL